MAASLVAPGSALALPPDPLDPPQVGSGDDFSLPANGFTWRVPSRFGARADGLIDYHWDASATPYGPGGAYDQAYVNPTSFPVLFNGCQTAADEMASSTVNTYTWTTPGATSAAPDSHTCVFMATYPAQGPYTVTLDVRAPDGSPLPAGRSAPFSQPIVVKDWLIVSIGDSYASGEGNPDVPQRFDFFGFVQAGARWQDKRCHRSAYAGAAQAALAFEASDPHTSVTFISLACSGATIDRNTLQDGKGSQPQGSGLLSGYRGAEPAPGTGFGAAERLPAQIDALAKTLNGRPIDALIVSGGGNDIGFANIVGTCAAVPRCFDALVPEDFGDPDTSNLFTLAHVVNAELAALPARYDRLSAAIRDPAPAGRPPISVSNIFLTQYPDFSRGDNGDFCPGLLDDILPGLSMTAAESAWAGGAIFQPFDSALRQAAARNGWHFVDGISAEFAGSPTQPGHGYCAADNWVRRAQESRHVQGPLDVLDSLWFLGGTAGAVLELANGISEVTATKGTLHPTVEGHQAYARHILPALQQYLVLPTPPTPATRPTLALNTTTSRVGADGWLTGTCAAGQTCSSDQVVLTATTTAGGPGVNIQGASVIVDGTPGCAQASITCTSHLTPATSTAAGAHVWSFTITAEGIHHLQFIVRDSNSVVVSFTQEVKVDLHDPTASASITSGGVATSGWYRSPVEVTLSGSDPGGGSGVERLEYQLDGGAVTIAPPGGKIRVTTDGVHSLSYRAVDLAGRASPQQSLSFKIDQAPPATSITPAPGALPTGVPLITVTGTATVKTTAGTTLGEAAFTCFDTSGLKLGLAATDANGSGPASLTYAATGAQPIASTTLSAASAQPNLTALGVTTLTFAATDMAGNREATHSASIVVGRGFACAGPTPTFSLPAHGTLAVTGTATSNGRSAPFSQSIVF